MTFWVILAMDQSEREMKGQKKDILILPWSEDWYSIQKTENILLFLCSSDI